MSSHSRKAKKHTALFVGLLMSLGCSRAPDTASFTEQPDAARESPGVSPAAESVSGFGPAGEWVLTPSRVGPVEIGIGLSEALPYLQEQVDTASIAGGCGYVVPRDAPTGVRLMVEERRVVRADVFSGETATPEGAGIGDDEQRILQLYPSARRVPHKYTTGSYLVVMPFAPSDTLRRYVFETDGQRVTVFRAGLFPPVEYVEGCS